VDNYCQQNCCRGSQNITVSCRRSPPACDAVASARYQLDGGVEAKAAVGTPPLKPVPRAAMAPSSLRDARARPTQSDTLLRAPQRTVAAEPKAQARNSPWAFCPKLERPWQQMLHRLRIKRPQVYFKTMVRLTQALLHRLPEPPELIGTVIVRTYRRGCRKMAKLIPVPNLKPA
jgi:hypothetical protein